MLLQQQSLCMNEKDIVLLEPAMLKFVTIAHNYGKVMSLTTALRCVTRKRQRCITWAE